MHSTDSGRLRSRLAVVLLIVTSTAHAAEPLTLPDRKPLTLKPVGTLNRRGAGIECSGIACSPRHKDLLWTINDSGNEPRIYPIRRNGSDYPGPQTSRGVLINGAKNVDWEEITVDDRGRLVIADVGNNKNGRKDLRLYVVEEPQPAVAKAPVVHKIPVRYPDQTAFPAPTTDFNFDCEAVFTVGKTVHLLTKHRSDAWTKLYQLNDPQPDCDNVLTLIDRFHAGGMVTGAAASPDGLRLAMITYVSVWLFERDTHDTPFFRGRISWAPFVSLQMESVCFADENTLLLVDEKLGQLFEVPIADLTRVQ